MAVSVKTRAVIATAICSATVVFAACASNDDAAGKRSSAETVSVRKAVKAATPQQVVTFVAKDFAFVGPKQVPAGLTELRLDNRGGVDHQLALFHTKPGVTAAQVLGAAGTKGIEATRAFGDWVAGPNGTGAGTTTAVVTELEPGNYIVACVIPDENGNPHVMKGMLTNLTVTAPKAPIAHEATGLPEVTLADYQFRLPDGFDGHGSVVVANRGTKIHEAVIARLRPGTTVNDVLQYETSPYPRHGAAPEVLVEGTTLLNPGEQARLDLDLPAGQYAWLCFLPGAGNKPHLALGMVHPFTVH